MKLTLKWLEKNDACQSGIDWYKQQGTDDFLELCKRARDARRFDDYRWCFARRVERKTRIMWACYAAELVLSYFEKLYPDDNRPRLAIYAARKCAEKNTAENRSAAYAAYAANAAADAAASVAYAAAAVAYAVDAAAYAADAADAASAAAYKAKEYTQIKIMGYGIKLLEEKCKKS